MDENRTPFHAGEIAVQTRAGVAEEVDATGIRSGMPDQHRRFFEALPFLALGLLDCAGRPWVVPVWDTEIFARSPDSHHLALNAPLPFATALDLDLSEGSHVGVLGIEPETRRRNRMNGRLTDATGNGLTIRVDQSFGNCPQYIQRRGLTLLPPVAPVEARTDTLSQAAHDLIARADTFFIASRTADLGPDPRRGVDASHRGGRPGFVCVDADSLLTFPDFAGNRFFNTLGNIEADGRVGLCFPDWQTGDILFLTGHARIVWDRARIEAFAGAERLVEVQIDDSLFAPAAFATKGDLIEAWPPLDDTGTWPEAAADALRRDGWRRFRIEARVDESAVITSFYLEPSDGGPVESYLPGQFLPVRLNGDILRNYTLSQAPTSKGYRISVKREAHGTGSRYLHDRVQVGDGIEVGKPAGAFTLTDGDDPVVLLSAGVGITPMIALLDGLAQAVERGAAPRPVWFMHAARNGRNRSFAGYLDGLRLRHDWLHVFTSFSRPDVDDALGETHDGEDRIDIETLKTLLPFAAHHFYLCGPKGFMCSLYGGLRDTGIDVGHIHHEFFGDGDLGDAAPQEKALPVPDTASVHFDVSGTERVWTSESGSLLDLAESAGLSPKFNCRKGNCGTCAVRLISGKVAYDIKPAVTPPEGQALICCARPADEEGVVLRV